MTSEVFKVHIMQKVPFLFDNPLFLQYFFSLNSYLNKTFFFMNGHYEYTNLT